MCSKNLRLRIFLEFKFNSGLACSLTGKDATARLQLPGTGYKYADLLKNHGF